MAHRRPRVLVVNAHRLWLAGSRTREEFSSVRSRALARAEESSGATSRMRAQARLRRELALADRPRLKDWRAKATTRMTRSLRSERRLRDGCPNQTDRSRRSFSQLNSTRRAPVKCAI